MLTGFGLATLPGGPVQSITSLVNYLGNDINFNIVTTNCDLNSDRGYVGIEPNKWIKSTPWDVRSSMQILKSLILPKLKK